MELRNMNEIINGKRYRTESALVIAGNDFWDGHNFERGGTNTWLLKTPRGAYFVQHQTQWQGERDYIEPVTEAEAKDLFEQLTEHRAEYEEAFGVEAEEA